MNFQNLSKVENYQAYLNMAFKSGKLRLRKLLVDKPKLKKDKDAKRKHTQYMEIEQIRDVQGVLCGHLRAIHEKFPGLDSLPPFYNQLAHVTIRYQTTKQALGSMNWAEKQCKEIAHLTITAIKKARTLEDVQKKKGAFYGRISSVMKQMQKHLAVIDETRQIMKTWPDIKTEIRTITIAGYPNVGKSSILKALTSAQPEIKAYAFTTKKLNIGYCEREPRVYQLIDTPGTFDRDIEEMNNIEKQALLVVKLLAEKIIYVFDPSESCGYEVELQMSLLKRIEAKFDKPIIVVANKLDLDKTKFDLIKKEYPHLIEVSVKEGKGIEQIRKAL
ncbi:MAG: GTPase [Candidatus Woesearchaeota archaeon]|jgi:nucleolar GTP-binding protein